MKMDQLTLCVALFSWQTILVAGSLAVLLFMSLCSSSFSEAESFYLALLAVLTPPLMTHGYLFFTEIYSATVLLALVLLYRAQKTNGWEVFWYGVGIFFLAWLHIKNLPIVSALCGLWGLRCWRE